MVYHVDIWVDEPPDPPDDERCEYVEGRNGLGLVLRVPSTGTVGRQGVVVIGQVIDSASKIQGHEDLGADSRPLQLCHDREGNIINANPPRFIAGAEDSQATSDWRSPRPSSTSSLSG